MRARLRIGARERRLLVVAALVAVVVASSHAHSFYKNREAKILTLRADIAGRSSRRPPPESPQALLPVPWLAESTPSAAALRLHDELEERATALALRVESVHASATAGGAVDAEMRVTGRYADTIALLAALGQSAPPLLVTELTLVRHTTDPGREIRLDGTIVVRAYLSGAEGE